ncbi:tetraspanin-8-like [Eucyclogobius newberryi]|uniref:tetraspanin-8-like n=1 Tax=Eucyclogobius newberryi TaxID=166745 RepID=UPI003B598BFB
MGTVNACVKRGYITVASLIAILSGLLLAITLFSHGHFHEDEEIERVLPGLQVMYATSIITILLVTTGLYGICKRKKWMLICYIVGMTLCCMLLSVLDLQGVAARPKLVEDIRVHYSGLLHFSNASKEDLEGIGEIQTELQCCGISQGYQDWGYNISESCLCVEGAVHPCVAAPRNSSLFENTKTDEPIMIYKEPCIIYLAMYALFALDVLLGIILGTILLWVLSVVLCGVTLCQMNRKEDTPAVVYSPEAKAGNYSVLIDDAEVT